MKIAVMQPYFFPYLGYFQLVHATNRFVFYDDVTYIKGGWINRNRWLSRNGSTYFTIPVQDASSFRSIAHTQVVPKGAWVTKLRKTFQESYGKAPCFTQAFELLDGVLSLDEPSIARWAATSVRAVANYLDPAPRFIETSARYGNAQLKAAERVLDICRQESASVYINAIGGQALYDPADFSARGVELRFLRTRPVTYRQFREPFVASLSILDVIAFNPREIIRQFLQEYDLV
jgi:hypothetical protein